MNDILALLLLDNKRGDCDVKVILIQQLYLRKHSERFISVNRHPGSVVVCQQSLGYMNKI